MAPVTRRLSSFDESEAPVGAGLGWLGVWCETRVLTG